VEGWALSHERGIATTTGCAQTRQFGSRPNARRHTRARYPPLDKVQREREREKLNTLSARFAHGSHRRIGSLVLASTHIVKADSVRVEISCAAGYLLLAALVLATAVIWFCLRRRSKGEAPRYKEVLLPSGGRVSIPVN
jgi:hypothetical protein